MRIKILIASLIIGMFFNTASYAHWFSLITDLMKKSNKTGIEMLSTEYAILNVQRDILSSQRDIESLMRDVNGDLTGHAGWGTYQSYDHQSYGGNARDWSYVLQMAESGRGDGVLGQMIKGLANQFPTDNAIFNKGIPDATSQKYYALQAQTILAVRAASQLDYNKVQDQIEYQHMLQQQIEKTKDLKGAMDLSNRLQVESNLIQLELLRQAALSNQQQAISSQAAMNSALSHARFLTK